VSLTKSVLACVSMCVRTPSAQTAHKYKLEVYVHSVTNLSDDKSNKQGITLVMDRNKKTYSTAIALPEYGTARFNEMLTIECTLYKTESESTFSSKPFALEIRAVRDGVGAVVWGSPDVMCAQKQERGSGGGLLSSHLTHSCLAFFWFATVCLDVRCLSLSRHPRSHVITPRAGRLFMPIQPM
jgi:hypothetical protein